VMNNRGFMRVVEATIAIILVLGSLIILASRQDFEERKDLSEILPQILNEIAHDEGFRRKIVGGENVLGELESFVDDRIENPSLKFEIKICELDDLCSLTEAPENSKDIYVAERVISTSIEEPRFDPKKVRIFLWRA